MTHNFGDKITKIRNGLESVSLENLQFSITDSDQIIDLVFDQFQPVTEQMHKVVVTFSSATCVLDPIPTQIIKICINALSPVLTKITNVYH